MTKKTNDLNKATFGFGVNEAPFWVFHGIDEPSKERFNNTRWMRIAELLQKEQTLALLEKAIMENDENGKI